MFRHALLLTGRHLRRDVLFSLVNVAGLAAGLAAVLVLAEVLVHETSYDRDLPGSDRTYRVAYETTFGGVERTYARGPSALLPALETEFPAVEAAATLLGHQDALVRRPGEQGDMELGKAFYASGGFFSVFPHPFVYGAPASALRDPDAIVLTRSAALRMFGRAEVVGEAVALSTGRTHRVTAVVDPVSPSHLEFDALVYTPPGLLTLWNGFVALTYVRLRPDANPSLFERRVAAYVQEHAIGEWSGLLSPFLQGVRSIHLQSRIEAEAQPNGSLRSVVVLALVTALTLLIAVSNYVNLSSLKAARRTREVGVRKAVGASRSQLAGQFLVESMAITLIAVPVALAVYGPVRRLVAPAGDVIARGLPPLTLVLTAVGLALVVGLLAGAYPAAILSRSSTSEALRGRGHAGMGGSGVRRFLMGFQFVATLGFVLLAAVVVSQMRFVASKDLGYRPNQVLFAKLWAPLSPAQFDGLAREVSGLNGVKGVSYGELPGVQTGGYFATDTTGRSLLVHRYLVGPGYTETLGIEMAAGVPLGGEAEGLMLNETAVRHLGLKAPLGMPLRVDGRDLFVTGVMRDFHFFSLYDPVPPVYAYGPPTAGPYLLVQAEHAHMARVARDVSALWDRRGTGTPLALRDLSHRVGAAYRDDAQLGRLLTAFAVLAAGVAYLGLFTMVSYVMARRRKELALRRVFGAPKGHLVWLVGAEGVAVLGVAAVIAIAVAVIAGGAWLEGFEHRVGLPLLAFALILCSILALTLSLTFYHVWAESRRPPAPVLKEP